MQGLASERQLNRAARRCMRRSSAKGADGRSWADYRRDYRMNIQSLSQRLTSGVWKPGPTRDVRIVTFTGKKMTLSIPTVEDRIVHRALRNLIEPILEERAFADFVSGFRPGRSRITAVRQAYAHVATGLTHVADVDVESVSEGASIDEVVSWVARWIADGSLLSVLRTALGGLPFPLAPGGGLSPMLLSLRLVPVDQALGGEPVVRFADNFCVFTPSRPQAEAAYLRLESELAKLRLRPSLSKSSVRDTFNPEDLFLIGG